MEQFEARNRIDQAAFELDKARTMLETVLSDYSFSEKPDPRAAIEHYTKVSGIDDRHGYNSLKWFWEYDRIYQFLDICCDYIYRTQETLKEINLKTQEATK